VVPVMMRAQDHRRRPPSRVAQRVRDRARVRRVDERDRVRASTPHREPVVVLERGKLEDVHRVARARRRPRRPRRRRRRRDARARAGGQASRRAHASAVPSRTSTRRCARGRARRAPRRRARDGERRRGRARARRRARRRGTTTASWESCDGSIRSRRNRPRASGKTRRRAISSTRRSRSDRSATG